jgi:DNA mismatch repair protein MSH3
LALANLYLRPGGFELKEALLHVEAFAQFATGNLEIYRNQTDYSVKGSLLWLMDHTKTKMGKRMLRDWIGRPLVNIAMLEERLDAITELKDDNTLTLEKLKGLLKGQVPDLGRGLSRIQYGRVRDGRNCSSMTESNDLGGQATPGEAVSVLIAFQRLADEFQPDLPTGTPKSGLLTHIASSFPKIRAPVARLLSGIDIRKAKADKPEDMFTNQDDYPDITTARAVGSLRIGSFDSNANVVLNDRPLRVLKPP